MIKTLDLNISGTKKNIAPKQRPDRFPSSGDHIQVTPTFEHTRVTPRHTVIKGQQSDKKWQKGNKGSY